MEVKAFNLAIESSNRSRDWAAKSDGITGNASQAEVDAPVCLQAETAAKLEALLPAILDRALKGEF